MEILFLYVGLLFAALGVAIAVSEAKSRAGALRVPGRIAGFSTKEGKRSYYAVVAYDGLDGVRRYVVSTVGSSSPLGGVGDAVTVLAHPDDPQRAAVESPLTYVIGAVIGAMGLACCAVFFVVFRANTLSIAMAGGVTLVVAYKALGLVRGKPKSLDAWKQARAAISSAAVFTEATRASIAWANPDTLRTAALQQRRANRFAGPFLLVAGAGLVLLGWHLEKKTEAFLERALPARGRVVRLESIHSSDQTTWAPVVEFEAFGREYTFRDSVSSNPPSYRNGDEVAVLYDPSNPTDARIDRGIWNKLVPLLVGAFGVVFCCAGILVLKRRAGPLPSFEPA